MIYFLVYTCTLCSIYFFLLFELCVSSLPSVWEVSCFLNLITFGGTRTVCDAFIYSAHVFLLYISHISLFIYFLTTPFPCQCYSKSLCGRGEISASRVQLLSNQIRLLEGNIFLIYLPLVLSSLLFAVSHGAIWAYKYISLHEG